MAILADGQEGGEKALSSHRLGNLRAVRERRVLSQVELAEVSGVSRATVNALEAGRSAAQPRTIRRLAEALGVDPLDLIGTDTVAEKRPVMTERDRSYVDRLQALVIQAELAAVSLRELGTSYGDLAIHSRRLLLRLEADLIAEGLENAVDQAVGRSRHAEVVPL